MQNSSSNSENMADRMREFTSRFRFQDHSLGSLSREEKRQIIEFQKFINQKPDGYCSVCMRMLYPEERAYREISEPTELNCVRWNLAPIMDRTGRKYMVCKSHRKTSESEFPVYVYPGNLYHESIVRNVYLLTIYNLL